MKRVLAIAALLMVSCGGNQNNTTTVVEKSPKKVSKIASQNKQSEDEVITPKIAPINAKEITADKDVEYLNRNK